MKKTWQWAACGHYLLVGYGYKSTKEIVELCRYAGITAIEPDADFSNGKSDKELEQMGKEFRNAGISLYSFHLPFGEKDDISSFYETKRREAVKKMKVIMEQAAILGSSVVILHPLTTWYPVETEGLDRYLSQLGKSLNELIPAAERLNLTIALENLLPVPAGDCFGSTPEHFEIFAREFAHPHLGFCLDTGHANVSCESDGPTIFFDVMKKYLVAFHLQDNSGDRDLHLAPGHGLINWKSVFRRMAKIRFSHPACVEALPFGPATYYKYSKEVWKNFFKEVEALAEKSLK